MINATVITDTSGVGAKQNVTTGVIPSTEGLVSDFVRSVVEVLVEIGLCQLVSAMGVVTNVLIIVVFLKQGISDSVTICLFTIAFWDLTTCTLALFSRFYGIIRVVSPALSYTWEKVTTLTLTTSQIYATYVSNCLGSYIALERFICVTFPFQASSLLTPRRTTIANVSISVFVFCSFIYYQFAFKFVTYFHEGFNATVTEYTVSRFYLENSLVITTFRYSAATVYTNASFFITTVCAVVIMYRLKKSAKFRQASGSSSTAAASDTSQISSKERRVGVMLLTISVLYILLALLPKSAANIAHMAEPQYSSTGRYRNLFWCIAYLAYLTGLLNAAVNFFVLLRMNTAFNTAFYDLFSRKQK